jgi:DNA-binding CsgD family transcriptional regulator
MTAPESPADNRSSRPLPTVSSAKVQQRMGDIFELWDDLNDFGKDKTDAALKHCMEHICGWLDAQDAFWVGAVHVLRNVPRKQSPDALSGWRIRAIQPLHPQYHDPKHYKKVVKAADHADLDLGATSIALGASSGRFRAYTLQGGHMVDLAAFQQTAHYDFYYRQHDIRDRIWVVTPVNADTESYFCFDRMGDRPHFDDDDLELAAFALRGIKWFHRQLMLSYGLGLCEDPLTPAEQRVIQGLLSGASEREIAETMKLSQGTVHQYATRIYQKFAVRGRVEFTALWLSGDPAAKAAAPETQASGDES